MTVSTTESQIDYTGNGATVFAIPFLFLANSDLVLTKMDANDAVTTLVLGSDYTLSGAGNSSGGTATLATPLTTGNRLRIARSMVAVQETDLRNQGKFYQQTIEDAFDYVTLLIQQYRTAIANSMQKSIGGLFWDALGLVIRNVGTPVKASDAATKAYVDSGDASQNGAMLAQIAKTVRVPENISSLPSAAARIGKLLSFDASGNPIAIAAANGPVNDSSAVLWSRTYPEGTGTVKEALSAGNITIWEFSSLVTSRPDPENPKTWDWQPALQGMLNSVASLRSVSVTGLNGNPMAGNTVLDLCGMEFTISSPVTIPSGVGGYTLANGTISASSTFPLNSFLLDTDASSITTDSLGLYNVFLNGNNRASCVRIRVANIRARWDMVTLYRFSQYGLYVTNSGIEFLISRTFIFKEWAASSPASGVYGVYSKTCTDQHFSDIVIFGAQYGIYCEGSTAGRFNRVHSYMCEWGIYLQGNTAGNSISDCYFDGCKLNIDNPNMVRVINNYFIYTGSDTTYTPLVLRAVTSGHISRQVIITNNNFHSTVATLVNAIVALADGGTFSNLAADNVVTDNTGRNVTNMRATRFKIRQAVSSSSTSGSIDISGKWLFGQIGYAAITAIDTQGGGVSGGILASSATTSSISWKATTGLIGNIYLEVDTGL